MNRLNKVERAESNNTTKVQGGSGLEECSDTLAEKSDAIFGVMTSAHEAALHSCDMPPPFSCGDSFYRAAPPEFLCAHIHQDAINAVNMLEYNY